MANPLVSIIIPVYNVEQFIGDCLKSVLNQTYRPLEIIIIDDRGNDKSMEIAIDMLDKAKTDELSFIVLHHDHNLGLSMARNTGTYKSNGAYLMFLDSDDQIVSTMVAQSMTSILASNADFSICDFYSDIKNDNRGGHLLCTERYLDGMSALKAFNKGLIGVSAWGKIIKRNFLFDNNIFFVPCIVNEDEPWFFKMLICAKKIALVQDALYYYRYNQNSIMSNTKIDKMILSNKVIVEEFLRIINADSGVKNNSDIYLAYMRVLVLYFTRLVNYNKSLPNLKRFGYNADYWGVFSKAIPAYYRLWNIGNYLPKCLQSLYLSIIIKLQKIR